MTVTVVFTFVGGGAGVSVTVVFTVVGGGSGNSVTVVSTVVGDGAGDSVTVVFTVVGGSLGDSVTVTVLLDGVCSGVADGLEDFFVVIVDGGPTNDKGLGQGCVGSSHSMMVEYDQSGGEKGLGHGLDSDSTGPVVGMGHAGPIGVPKGMGQGVVNEIEVFVVVVRTVWEMVVNVV